jgi:DNA-binding NtrC family response regulator
MTVQIKKILLVDDEEKILDSIAQRLRLLGFDPVTAKDGMAALDIAKKQHIDLAVVDLQMPDMNGLVTITKLKEIRPSIKTVLLTGYGNEKVKQTTESLRTLYFEKDEMADFWNFIKKINTAGQVVVIRPTGSPASQGNQLGIPTAHEIEVRSRRDYAKGVYSTDSMRPESLKPPRIVGETSAMQELRKQIERVAPLDCPVILRGEPGTGKELAARAIHASCAPHDREFIAIDCTAFESDQNVAQLIGYAGGDLCEAIRTRSGIFNRSRLGTLLFDHVDKMPPTMQKQLLHIIHMGDERPPNRSTTEAMHIRMLATTEVDLKERTSAGRFDKALFDRLNLFELFLPPLRQRKDDIPPLIRYFFDKYRYELSKQVYSISPDVVSTLADYDFPANVRELEHIVERAVILAEGDTIESKHLPVRFIEDLGSHTGPRKTKTFLSLSELEKRYIFEVLESTNGNKSKTAEILGISRAALWRKLKQSKTEASSQ